MSWLDQIENKLTITCGDGQQYAPNWINAKKVQEYNTAEFDFPNIGGTLVKRNKPLGVKYALEIYFQGEQHLDTAKRFHVSANDPRPWILEHPYYGRIIVQPIALEFDNAVYNITKITGPVIETITEDAPVTSISVIDEIPIIKEQVDTEMKSVRIVPSPVDVSNLYYNNERNFKLGVPIITIPEEFENYNYAFNIANAAVSTAIANASLATNLTIGFINKPALFTASLQTRMQTLSLQFANLRQGLSALTNPNSKYWYQITAGSVIGAMGLATSLFTDADKKLSAANVLYLMNQINANYAQYMADLDTLQTLNGGNTTSFIPTATAITALNNLINLAVSNLFAIALNSKQQRTFVTDVDTNIILLTHQLYGLDPQDENISDLMAENNIGLNEILLIKKGRKILYYI